MANIIDYVKWRGDISIKIDSFNEVDNLIFAELVYLNLAGIVPPLGSGETISIKDAANKYFEKYPDGEKLGAVLPQEITKLFKEISGANRFSEMRLSNFVNEIDHKDNKQFAALTVETNDKHIFVSFRGTDDTLAGWKEDFLLACEDKIPSHVDALNYTKIVAKRFRRKKIRIGGHSKGGNLAMYAGICTEPKIQNKIQIIYNNDGPGFQAEILESANYTKMKDKIHSIVPQNSIVGMLMYQDNEYNVVMSTEKGIFQHDGFSWQIDRKRFIRAEKLTDDSVILDKTIDLFLKESTIEQRKAFVEGLFEILSATSSETLLEIQGNSRKTVRNILSKMKNIDDKTKEAILDTFKLIVKLNLSIRWPKVF